MSPDSTQDLWPKWMWVAVPVLVVIVVAGLWWAIFSDGSGETATPTATATVRVVSEQPTQSPTLARTLPPVIPTMTQGAILPTTEAPTSSAVQTPSAAPTIQAGLAVGDNAVVTGTSGVLNMRDGAGTAYNVVGTLREGAVVEVVGGPTEADGYTWWQVRTDAGVTAWAAGEWLKKQ